MWEEELESADQEEINLIFERKKLKEAIRRNQWQKARKKIEKRLLEGWEDVHDELKALPFCMLQEQATKVFFCRKCNSCGITGKCTACMHMGVTHSLVDREVVTFLMKSGVKTW